MVKLRLRGGRDDVRERDGPHGSWENLGFCAARTGETLKGFEQEADGRCWYREMRH